MESRKVFFRGSIWRGSKNSQDENSLISLILMHEDCRHENKHGTQTHMMAQKRTFTLPGGSFSGSMLVFRGCYWSKSGESCCFWHKSNKSDRISMFFYLQPLILVFKKTIPKQQWLHSLKLTACTWKTGHPKPTIRFQVQFDSFIWRVTVVGW